VDSKCAPDYLVDLNPAHALDMMGDVSDGLHAHTAIVESVIGGKMARVTRSATRKALFTPTATDPGWDRISRKPKAHRFLA
jgi:hypothetical protein